MPTKYEESGLSAEEYIAEEYPNIEGLDFSDAISYYDRATKEVSDYKVSKETEIQMLKEINEQISKKKSEIAKLKSSIDSTANEQAELERNAFAESQIQDIEFKIKELEQDYHDLKEESLTAIEEVNEDDVKAQYEKESEMILKVRNTLTKVNGWFDEKYGTQLMEEVRTKVDMNTNSKLDNKALEKLKTNYNNIKKKLFAEMKKEPKDYSTIIESIFFDPKKLGNASGGRITIYFIYLGLLIWLLSAVKVLIPVILTVYLGNMLITVYKDFMSTRVLMDNYAMLYSATFAIDNKEMEIYESIEGQIEYIKKLVKKEYETYLDKIKEQVAKLEDEREQAYENALTEFDMEGTIDRIKRPLENKLKLMETELDTLTKRRGNEFNPNAMKEMQTAFFKMIRELKLVIEKQAKDLSGISKSKTLLSKFFLGFDSNEQPMFIDWGKKTTLVIYEDNQKHQVQNMIYMMITQLMKATNIYHLNLTLHDMENSGTEFSVFLPNKEAEAEELFKLVTAKNDIDSLMNRYKEIMEEVRQKALSKFTSLHDFNQTMIDKNSGTLDYFVSFLYSYEPSIFANDVFKQVIKGSHEYGIIPVIFVNENVIRYVSGSVDVATKQRLKKHFDKGYAHLFGTIEEGDIYTIKENGLNKMHASAEYLHKLKLAIEHAKDI